MGAWQGRQCFPVHCLCLLPPHTSAPGPRPKSRPPSGHSLFWRLLGCEQWGGGARLLEIGKKYGGWFPERRTIHKLFHCHRPAVRFWESQLPSLNLCFPPSVKYKKCSVHPEAVIQQQTDRSLCLRGAHFAGVCKPWPRQSGQEPRFVAHTLYARGLGHPGVGGVVLLYSEWSRKTRLRIWVEIPTMGQRAGAYG